MPSAAQPAFTARLDPYDRLRDRLYVETDLAALVMLFAEAIAADGIGAHQCLTITAGGPVPLFGDSDTLIHLWPAPDRSIAVGTTDDRVLLVDVAVTDLEPARLARLRGYATLYAARGGALAEVAADVATACPLGLDQRAILAGLLTGERRIDIAARLGMSCEALSLHVERAIASLDVTDAARAVAHAARKGWLMLPADDSRFLFKREVR